MEMGCLMISSNNEEIEKTPKYSNVAEDIELMQYSKTSRNKRPLKDLSLIDAFMFEASTERIQDAEVVARIIAERAIGQKLGKIIVEPEKSIRGIDFGRRGVRLDLFISELDNEKIVRVYDIEPNNYNLKNLPKRDRYNQALSDVKLLDSGADFEQLPDYVSIWILPDDPFDGERMIYTVKNMVTEDTDIVYNDGIKRLFLNAKGSVGGNDELRALLNYICDSCEENATDPDLKKLHNIVKDVKQNRKVGEQYMHYMSWEELARLQAEKSVTEELKSNIKKAITDEITREVTEEVTKAVTEEVTKAVTEEVMKADVAVLIKTCVKLGAMKEDIVKTLMDEYSLTQEQAESRIKDVSVTVIDNK